MTQHSLRQRAVRRALTRLAVAALLTSTLPVAAADRPEHQSRERFEVLWPESSRVLFEPTTLEERAAFAKLIPQLLRAAPHTSLPPEGARGLASSAGFVLETWRFEEDALWVLRERPDRLRGAGAYVIRTGAASEDFVQAPHAYFDLGTGELAAALFLEAPANRRPRVFATNTAHRYRSRPGELRKDQEHPADVAHNAEHLFTWVTDLVAQELPSVRVIQLHGFGKEELPQRKGISAIVSSGSRRAPKWIHTYASRLSPALGSAVRLFPEQTSELGGTQNAQGKLLARYPKARFIHLELSAPVRESLSKSGAFHPFSQVLFAPGEE